MSIFFPKRVKHGIYFLLLFFIFFSRIIKKQQKQITEYSIVSNKKGFLVPFIRGQGLNNQLWEYRSSAIIAKVTGRILCLEPFHRFYLQKVGRRFIPFEELFDVESLRKFVEVTASANCAQKCKHKIDRHIELVTKPAVKIMTVQVWPFFSKLHSCDTPNLLSMRLSLTRCEKRERLKINNLLLLSYDKAMMLNKNKHDLILLLLYYIT
jgi:hypothetical protein